MKPKLYIFALFILPCVLFCLSCNSPTQPLPNSGYLGPLLSDASCTEVWIELKTNGITFPVKLNLLNDNAAALVIDLSRNDPTIYIDSLLPNNSYEFQVQLTQRILNFSSNKIEVHTLDTTSNNFTRQTYTFGASNAGRSNLLDVAIINGNDIWVVGAIYMDDSTGQPDPQPYNLATCNCVSWKLQKVVYQGIPPVIHSIFAFNENNNWLDAWLHWNGQKFQEITIDQAHIGFGISRICGTGSNDLYIVGNYGNIVHYNVNTWQKINSGTSLGIIEIWGYTGSNNEEKIICLPSNKYSGYGC